MTIRGNTTYNRYRVRRNTTEPGFSFIARFENVSQTLLIPGLRQPNPLDLFSAGQPGGFADPYDLTKMWVDDAGTTPMTLANLGTGIGRVVTKGHTPITLVQANAADRPVWGRHPVSGIRNLLNQNINLSESPFSAGGVGITLTDGFSTGDQGAIITGVSGSSQKRFLCTTDSLTGLRVSILLKAGTHSNAQIRWFSDTTRYVNCDLASGAIAGFGAGNNASITTEGDGWYRVGLSSPEASGFAINLVDNLASARNETNEITNNLLVSNLQLELGSTATNYQRVTNRFDITEVGSPSLYYFDFNGVSRAWASNATVDFSSTNRMTIWGVVHKRSDVAAGRWCSLGVALPVGGFTLSAPPGDGAGSAGSAAKGLVATSFRHVGISAPATYTQSVEFNLTGTTNAEAIRNLINGTGNVIASGGTPGGGNFANDILQIGRDGASANPFNGRLYTVVIAGAAYDSRTVQRFSDYGLKPRRLITA